MTIYVVSSMSKYDYDFSVETRKHGCFRPGSRDKAIAKAREVFEYLKSTCEEEIEEYSNEEEYPDEDSGALYIEEDDEFGYYQISFGTEEKHECHCVYVDEYELEG